MTGELEVTPEKVMELRQSVRPPLLLDVRNSWEHELCRIDGSVLIPLNQLPSRVAEIDGRRPVVVYCHHGQRSLLATQYLRQEGIDAVSMRGGIDAWAEKIEPSMARY